MKKGFYVVLVAVLASCTTVPSTTKSSAAQPPGAAHPVLVTTYYPNGDVAESIKSTYDSFGRLVHQDVRNGNGIITEIRAGQSKGPAWRIATTNAQSQTVTSLEDLRYDSQGNVLVQTLLNSQGVPQASNEYTYDAKSRKLQWVAKSGDGELQARTVYVRDSSGNNVRTDVYDSGGALTNVFESRFDGQGQILSRTGYDASHHVVEVTTYSWKDGKKTKEETSKPLLRTIEYRYDQAGRLVESLSTVRGKVVERQTFQYE